MIGLVGTPGMNKSIQPESSCTQQNFTKVTYMQKIRIIQPPANQICSTQPITTKVQHSQSEPCSVQPIRAVFNTAN